MIIVNKKARYGIGKHLIKFCRSASLLMFYIFNYNISITVLQRKSLTLRLPAPITSLSEWGILSSIWTWQNLNSNDSLTQLQHHFKTRYGYAIFYGDKFTFERIRCHLTPKTSRSTKSLQLEFYQRSSLRIPVLSLTLFIFQSLPTYYQLMA